LHEALIICAYAAVHYSDIFPVSFECQTLVHSFPAIGSGSVVFGTLSTSEAMFWHY